MRARVRAQTTTELDPVDTGDSNVGEDEIRMQFARFLKRLIAVVGLLDEEAVPAKCLRIELSRLGIVFDDEDERRRRRRVAARGHLYPMIGAANNPPQAQV